ncbi:hypothetical protein B488_06080 [Liberibacter crescens BT-1]|uniref:ABC transporter domain-containing protein n=1 Tax=Liberibacter crescens (strain BT-1) TaxID=1215343 RepID=L0EUT9_LIBCB|nr:hypothetical protein B488_06080 [Liberibacter crescens BT-1]
MLLGKSGSGKSTLLRCINLLEIPSSGMLRFMNKKIFFNSKLKIQKHEINQIRMQIGTVFQNFQLFPHLTAIQNIIEGLIVVHKWPKPKAYSRAIELLRKVSLLNKADSWPAHLSGGQQQRIAIARALAAFPSVLLCDEPTSALDPELSAEVIKVLLLIAHEGTSMVIATHDLKLAKSIANYIIFLEEGRIIAQDTAHKFFSFPQGDPIKRFISKRML